MKRFCINAFAAVSGILCVSGCAGEVFNESVGTDPTGELRVVTRSGDESTTPLAGASVYLFNNSGACASILTSDASGTYASAKLPAGTYTLYALGGDGLSSLVLPTQAEATPSSVLTLAENQSLGDLLMTQSSVTLDDGASEDVSLALERKVLEITSVTIKQVPDDITGVQVSVGALYGQVQLNGEYVVSSTAPCVITLTSQGSGTWAATPQFITFPSKSKPVITITFTADGAEPRSYSYSSDEELLANHKYNLEGTYTEPLGVTITSTITAQAWDSNATGIAFDFDESNSTSSSSANDPTDGPKAGDLYNDYYVVSVDASNRTAVLLSKTDVSYKNDVSDINTRLSQISRIEGSTGNWRVPTLTECQTFLSDPETPDISYGSNYYCLNNGELSRIKVENSNGTITFGNIYNTAYSNLVKLRPVIDISY